MQFDGIPAPKRLLAMLCMALMAVFAVVSLTTVIDQIQHAPGASLEHRHVMILSDVTAEPEHAAFHHEGTPGDSDPSDHLAGSHHYHHGETGSVVPGSLGAAAYRLALLEREFRLTPDDQVPGSRIAGLERPPKSLALNS